MMISLLPAATSAVTVDAKSPRIGYISRGSPTRTMETRPFCSVVTFISVHSTHAVAARTEVLAPELLDLSGELVAPAVDARFDGAFGQLQLLRDLVVRQLLDIAHEDGRAQRLRQRAHGVLEQLHPIALLHHRHLALRLADGHQLRGVDVAVDRLALFPDAAIVIDAEVAADADQPRLEVRAAVEGTQRLEDLEKDVLREVLGLVVPADELVRDVEHLPPVLPDDGFPRQLIALEAPLDERLDALLRRGSVSRRSCGVSVGGHAAQVG